MSEFDLADTGTPIDKISMIISYQIIDLFSGHLYSYPTKAIEELVVNSYDAFANNSYIYLPDSWDDPNVRVIVYDDGDSMDEDGLKELWLIADCKKRETERQEESVRRGRLPIGKFGIGKLASYVIGERISHFCKKNGKYLVVTMDYKRLEGRDSSQVLDLSIRELTQEEFSKIVPAILPEGANLTTDTFVTNENWTLVIIDRIKDRASQIRNGRLRWVISTALPLDPTFKVFLNDEEIEPSKIDEPLHKTWTIGPKDEVAEKLGYESFQDPQKEPPFNNGIIIPGLGPISGHFDLFKPTITGGKASKIVGRSNGFFVIVRNRLVNMEDSLFGLNALSHQTFNRFRGEIYVDGLDKYLVADREDVVEQGHELLSEYLKQKFYEARNRFDTIRQLEEDIWPEAIEKLPGDLVRYPLMRALERADNENITPFLIRRPVPGVEEHTIVNKIELEALETNDPVGIFDTETGTVKANTLHPFRRNFPSDDSYKNWATIETLTEAYLLDAGLDGENSKVVMEKRDRLMRILVRHGPVSASLIARNILETTQSEKAFEKACDRGFGILGYAVVPLGGRGEPDGIATAPLGVSDEGVKRTYKLVYDAKTSADGKVPASNLNLSAHKSHQDDYKANYGVIVAPDYEGEGEEAAAVKQARIEKITLMRAKDFAELVEASAVLRLPLTTLRDLFETCISPDETHDWVQRFKAEPQPLPPIKLILETIWELQTENPKDPVSFGAIKYKKEDEFKELSEKIIGEWLESLERLVPDLINVQSQARFVEINQSPTIIIEHLHASIDDMMDKEIGVPLKEQLID